MQQINLAGKPCTPNNPWLVDATNQPFITEAVTQTANLISFEKDAAGSTVVIGLTGRRVMDRMGSKIGSFWGDQENLQYSTEGTPGALGTVVLTDTAATVVINDSVFDLEKIFESATKARYVLKLTDMGGQAYYGFIGGVAANGSEYTFSVYTTVGLATNTWVKTWGASFAAPYAKAEIYEYSTSFEPTATTFNEELPYSEFSTDFNQLKGLADGQYRVDYRRGRFLGRKLDGANTATFSYIAITGPGAVSIASGATIGVTPPTTPTGGSKTVTTSGTAVALGTTLAIKSVYVRAKSTNTGNIYLGDSSVDVATSKQVILAANDFVTIEIADRASLYIDSDVNGEGVDYLCVG